MPETHPAAKLSLSFAKLVATPTETAWSQAYNAGNLFVCLSLAEETDEANEETSLHAIGKELFNVLQSEFITLQEKNVAHIKAAIQTSLENLPQQLTISLSLAFFKDTTLLVFIAGSGKIVMKRGEKVGVLLAQHGTHEGEIAAASGYVENGDTIILETGQFAEGIEQETVTQALDLELPNDIVEALSPQIHQQDNGAQAAIVISYRGASPTLVTEEQEPEEEPTIGSLYKEEELPPPHQQEEGEPEIEVEEPIRPEHKPLKLPKLPNMHLHVNFSHRRKLFLNIAIVIAILLVISIFFTIKKYNDDKEKALFQSVYPTAQQYYSEGNGLASVNPSLSQDSFNKAETLLKENESKFPKGSKDQQQITDLLAQVESKLQDNTAGQSTNASAIQPQSHSLLAVEQSMSDGLAFSQDENNIYVITNKAVTAVSKTDGSTKDIIKNNSDWSAPLAVVPYGGNVYVLDQKKGLLKFVASGGGYGKTNYFSGTSPDLSQSTGMAIDSSVWLVFKDGTLMEYTKGKSNNLQVTGLLKPLSNPTKIITDITMENVYVLDTGNSRVVQFDKNGKYVNAFGSSVIATAKDFDVSEKNKTIAILSQGKVWEMHF